MSFYVFPLFTRVTVKGGAFDDRSTSETPILHSTNFNFAENLTKGFSCVVKPILTVEDP